MVVRSFTVADLEVAFERRLFPTVTMWNRLEGRPRTTQFDRALRAEVRDALWMLTRQWQVGEFRGDDAGSPVLAKVHAETTRLTKYRAAAHDAEPLEHDVPFEAKVERRPVQLIRAGRPIGLDLRLLMGRQWLKLIAGIGDYEQAFRDRYPIVAPDPALPAPKEDADLAAHPDVWQIFAAVAGRRMDGGALYLHLMADPSNHVYDGVAVADADKLALDEQAARFVAWFDRLLFQSTAADENAWVPDRLEYQFACSAPELDGEKVFVADEYYQGRLDWYNVDIDPNLSTLGDVPDAENAGLPASVTRSLIPTPVVFEGMPNTRWWAFEDRKTNFGDIDAGTTDLAKLLFMEFALVYANDWFLIPYTLPAGTIATVRGFAVTNVFGERFWLDAAGRGVDDDWQRWSMFTVSVKGESTDAADTSLVLLPTVPKIQEGAPIEEVMLIRDEMANMAWGIERTVSLATGASKPGAEAATETLAFYERELDARLGGNPPAPISPAAPIRYRVMNTIPEHWIPFIPVHVPDDNREVQLQRAGLPRILEGDPDEPVKVRPRTALLREGLDGAMPAAYHLHEEEVPRAGVRLTQSFQRARGRTGRVFVWLGVRKQVGRGEGWSGLSFDQIVDVPPPE